MKKYLLPALFARVRLPLLGAVPWNIAALSGFAALGLENPAFWVAGGAFEAAWLAVTAGRPGWRRRIDARERREAWRELEASRLALYHRLGPAGRARHHALRERCREFLPAAGPVPEPDPPPGAAFRGPPRTGPTPAERRAALDLFAWLHLKLLPLHEAATDGRPPGVNPETLHRLRAAALVDLDDPAAAALAGRALDLLETKRPVAAEETEGLLRAIEETAARLADPRVPPLPADGSATGAVLQTTAGGDAAAATSSPSFPPPVEAEDARSG